MKLTIGFITAREEPHLDWLLESIVAQKRADDEIDLVVVDALDRTINTLVPDLKPRAVATLPAGAGASPRVEIESVLRELTGCVDIRVVTPKPNVWQGPHRVAQRDFFANANARNTAICYCRTDYIAFLDDRARLEPGWFDVVRRGEATRESVLCGPYDKLEGDAGGDTRLSIDSRRKSAPHGMRGCGGGWAFGGNFALPLEWLLEVNGCEEGCDPTGQEDCVLGLMLANRRRRIDFVTGMSVQQDRTGHVHPPAFPRLDKGPSPHDRSHAMITRFETRTQTEFTPSLVAIRELLAEGGTWPIPDPKAEHRDWYDQQLISTME